MENSLISKKIYISEDVLTMYYGPSSKDYNFEA